MKINEVMTPDPACCEISDSAHKAALIMRELNVGIVPIVESELSMKLVGVVTDRDLCLKIVAEGRDPKGVKLQECMTSELVTCKPDDDMQTVLQLMQQNQVRRIPVVGEDNRIEGIVATADMVLCGEFGSEDIDETMQDISEPTFEEFEHLSHLAVTTNDGNELTSLPPQTPPSDVGQSRGL